MSYVAGYVTNFQPTPPAKGSSSYDQAKKRPHLNFNPRPFRRRRLLWGSCSESLQSFNPRPPYGRSLNRLTVAPSDEAISIHSSRAGGVPAPRAIPAKTRPFQSTPPVREESFLGLGIDERSKISIHTSRVEGVSATTSGCRICPYFNPQIHTSRVEGVMVGRSL